MSREIPATVTAVLPPLPLATRRLRRQGEGGRGGEAPFGALLTLLILATALPLGAEPLLLPWGGDTASMAAGGSHAPAPLLGEVRPDAPTSLTLTGRPHVAAEIVSSIPFTYVQGHRRFVELRVDSRELRATVPLAADADEARWWLGRSLGGTSARLYHRDRWLDDRARAHGSTGTLALAWQDGSWTLGVARHEADLSGVATGENLADLLHTRRGSEHAQFGWDGRVDTLAAEFRGEQWLFGVQLSERDDTGRAALEVSGDPFAGVLSTDARELDAWVAHGPADDRWFAYLRCSDLSPGSSAIASGDAIRGRVSLAMDGTVVGIGRRRTDRRATEHTELTWQEQSVDLSGRLSTGALGSLDGQLTFEGSAGARIIAARWGATRERGAWHWTLAASAMHAELDVRASAIDSPGPFRAPDWQVDQRLSGGEAWLGSLTLGAGREVDGWQVDALYTLLAGDSSGKYEDLLSPQAALPPDPGTGPSPTLDLGWVFSMQVSREL